jgi:hypothetical protein
VGNGAAGPAGTGIGRALYEHVLGALASFDPILLRTFTQEDRPRSLRFLRDRGFVEEMRSWESRLDVNAFDPAPFALSPAMSPRKTSLSRPSANWRQTRIATERCTTRHGPGTGRARARADHPPPFDEWAKRFSKPNHLPDANFVALDTTDGDRYVGYSSLHPSPG